MIRFMGYGASMRSIPKHRKFTKARYKLTRPGMILNLNASADLLSECGNLLKCRDMKLVMDFKNCNQYVISEITKG